MADSIEERIKNVMAAVFEVPAEQINDDSSPDSIESWDSLKHMNLVVALEEEFKVQFSDYEIIEMINFPLTLVAIKEKI
jgi:acyl carrier protein